MKSSQNLEMKMKAILRSHLIGLILLAELILNASLYFALKSGNEPVTAVLIGMIVLGYIGLIWKK